MRGWKKGRPRKAETRDVMVKVYLTYKESQMLKSVCEERNDTRSSVLRKSFLYLFNRKEAYDDQMD